MDCSPKELEDLTVHFIESSTISKLLTADHCFPPRAKINVEGNILILKEIHLQEEILSAEHQLWIAIYKDDTRIVARSLMTNRKRDLTVRHFYGIAQQSKLPKNVGSEVEKYTSQLQAGEIDFWKSPKMGANYGDFRVISQLEEVLLLGKLSKQMNIEFSTWIYMSKSQALYNRHDWGTDYQKAKDDFAIRRGLLSEDDLP